MTNAKKKQEQEQDRKSRVKKKQEGQKLQMLPEEKTQKLPGEKMQKFPAEKPLETTDNKINRNIKDSVFCDLFGMPESVSSRSHLHKDGWTDFIATTYSYPDKVVTSSSSWAMTPKAPGRIWSGSSRSIRPGHP